MNIFLWSDSLLLEVNPCPHSFMTLEIEQERGSKQTVEVRSKSRPRWPLIKIDGKRTWKQAQAQEHVQKWTFFFFFGQLALALASRFSRVNWREINTIGTSQIEPMILSLQYFTDNKRLCWRMRYTCELGLSMHEFWKWDEAFLPTLNSICTIVLTPTLATIKLNWKPINGKKAHKPLRKKCVHHVW